MADIHFWIQIENRPWDACPHNIDRMHGTSIEEMDNMAPPISVTLNSPETGASITRTMYLPVNAGLDGNGDWIVSDALILRRYTDNWGAPDDRKVNPWDLNEVDPTDTGTMGTIPGPTLECNVGDRIIVHFRNKDFRGDLSPLERSHSLHPHGIVFKPEYDGAYPLSPADTTQPVDPGEAGAWASVGVTGGFKKGDRVPPGGTFTYVWETFGWPATAGVWHYHDHAICDANNVLLGARGFLVIHNPQDPDDVIAQDLPGGQANGALTQLHCFTLPDFPIVAHPMALERARLLLRNTHDDSGEIVPPPRRPRDFAEAAAAITRGIPADCDLAAGDPPEATDEPDEAVEVIGERHIVKALAIELGDGVAAELASNLQLVRLCFRRYVEPPQSIQILQYYAELPNVGMVINGRRFLGNTPTVIAGQDTRMRFGVAAMNNLTFHTFHLHGHRWTIPGPNGTNPGAIQSSVQNSAASQFEDTRIIGPANSFGFTINQGSFMGSRFTPDPSRADALGEWHMHCHVLNHMMPGGMMGSLLVINGGELAFALPRGEPKDTAPPPPAGNTVVVDNFAFSPPNISVPSGTQVTFDFLEANHTVQTVSTTGAASTITINNGGGNNDPIPVGQSPSVVVTGNPGDVISYMCGIHLAAMSGSITII